MLRSIPTIAPTKALTTTSNENCAMFSRSPRRMAGARWRTAVIVTRWPSPRDGRG